MVTGTDGDNDEMHHEVDWLKPSDRPILREVAQYPGWVKPATLALNLGYNGEHIQRRCRELHAHGLLVRYDQSTAGYRLSEEGRRFLDDELDVPDLEGDVDQLLYGNGSDEIHEDEDEE